jgi:hypothetical protein
VIALTEFQQQCSWTIRPWEPAQFQDDQMNYQMISTVTWIFLSGGSKHSTNADPNPPCWLFGASWMQHDAAHDVVSMADPQ